MLTEYFFFFQKTRITLVAPDASVKRMEFLKKIPVMFKYYAVLHGIVNAKEPFRDSIERPKASETSLTEFEF